jgi:DNA-binding MarR family transcriptional regulator
MSTPYPDPEQIAAFRQEHIGRYFLRAHRAFSERAFEKFQHYHHPGLRFTHMALIAQLDLEGTPITVLAERAGMTKQAMSQLVHEMEERGYVQRKSSPQDRRTTLVHFTDAGFRLLQDAYHIKQEIEAEYIAVLGEDGFKQLRSLLATLLDGLD